VPVQAGRTTKIQLSKREVMAQYRVLFEPLGQSWVHSDCEVPSRERISPLIRYLGSSVHRGL